MKLGVCTCDVLLLLSPLQLPFPFRCPVFPFSPQGLIRFWPWSCSSKQVLFLNELEDVLELLMDEQVRAVLCCAVLSARCSFVFRIVFSCYFNAAVCFLRLACEEFVAGGLLLL